MVSDYEQRQPAVLILVFQGDPGANRASDPPSFEEKMFGFVGYDQISSDHAKGEARGDSIYVQRTWQRLLSICKQGTRVCWIFGPDTLRTQKALFLIQSSGSVRDLSRGRGPQAV